MESLVPIGIWIVLGLVGLSLLTIAIFGVQSIAQGKIKPTAIVVVLIPVLLLLGMGFGMGNDAEAWQTAGVYTFLIMLVLTSASLLLTGFKSVFN